MLTDFKRTLSLIFAKKLDNNTPLGGLTGKVTIITGANRGIGKSIANLFYSEGAKIVLIGRDIKKLNTSFPKEKFPNAFLLELDVTDLAAVKVAIDKVLKRFHKIDILINNAGIFLEKPLEACTEKEINEIINTNIKGAINTCASAIPHLKKNNKGTIINIGSKISHNTNVLPKKVLYATTKYALEGFSFALNRELKPYGIRVICLMPGTVNTFLSAKSGNFMSPTKIAQVITMLVKFNDIDFESITFKSIFQNI